MSVENRRVVVKREGVRGGMEWEVSRCKPLYIGWISNKVLLYSKGNYIQYPMINHNGKEYEEKEYKKNPQNIDVRVPFRPSESESLVEGPMNLHPR